jgi:AmmeMemoRadiSam system protein A
VRAIVLPAILLPALLVAHAAAAQGPPPAPPPPETQPDPGASPPPEAPQPSPSVTPGPEADLDAPLDAAERDTLLRLGWRTLVGHLTGDPIRDADLESFAFTPRLLSPRGCWVTIRKGGQVHGSQGEFEGRRPLYQQVIIFVRRAATRDARFLPLTDLDLPDLTLQIALIGGRARVAGPEEIRIGEHGVYLTKWGRAALFLPEAPAAAGWSPTKTLQELCRQATLPADAWTDGARIEVFTTQVIAGARPAPPPGSEAPTPAPPPGSGGPAPGPAAGQAPD